VCVCDGYQIESAIQLLRGHVLEALENRSLAVECYREALQLDVHCYEALDCLIQHHMLTALEGFILLTFTYCIIMVLRPLSLDPVFGPSCLC